jgi:hypothetical protein
MELLPAYVEAKLSPELEGEIEAHLAECPECSHEMKVLKAENELLQEALVGLRPDQSLRMRVSRMCVEVHKKATAMANSLPERGWAIFRWSLGISCLFFFLVISVLFEPPRQTTQMAEVSRWMGERSLSYWLNILFFTLSIFMFIGGRLAVFFEDRLKAWFSRDYRLDEGPTRLAVLTLEVLGLLGLLASSLFHLYLLLHQ